MTTFLTLTVYIFIYIYIYIALLALDGQFSHVTNKQANEIKKLYLDLDEYEKKAIVFSQSSKKPKKSTGHVGTEAMARY